MNQEAVSIPQVLLADDHPYSPAEVAQRQYEMSMVLMRDFNAQIVSDLTVEPIIGERAVEWLQSNRPNGQHEHCANPIRCLADFDQSLMALRDGGILLVARFTIDTDAQREDLS